MPGSPTGSRPSEALAGIRFRYGLPLDLRAVGNLVAWEGDLVPATTVECELATFVRQKDVMYRVAPNATMLHLLPYGLGTWPPVLADPDVARWSGLGRVPIDHVDLLAAHPHLDALRTLELVAGEDIEPTVLDPIISAARFPQLTSLTVDGPIIDQQAPYLPAVPDDQWRATAFASTLRELSGELVDTLAPFPALESFETIFYGESTVRALAEGTASLRRLVLGPYDDDPLTMSMLGSLLATPAVQALTSLVLNLERAVPDGHEPDVWRRLEQLPLRELAVGGRWLDETWITAMREGPPLSELVKLRIAPYSTTRIALSSLAAFVASRPWPLLRELDLGEEIHGHASLTRSVEPLPVVRRLRCGVDDASALFASEAVNRLEVIQLHTDRRPVLPDARLANVRVLSLQFPWKDRGFPREHAETWARNRGLTLLPRPEHHLAGDALAFARLDDDFWPWLRGGRA